MKIFWIWKHTVLKTYSLLGKRKLFWKSFKTSRFLFLTPKSFFMAYPQPNNNPASVQHSNPLINMIQMNTSGSLLGDLPDRWLCRTSSRSSWTRFSAHVSWPVSQTNCWSTDQLKTQTSYYSVLPRRLYAIHMYIYAPTAMTLCVNKWMQIALMLEAVTHAWLQTAEMTSCVSDAAAIRTPKSAESPITRQTIRSAR